jgi:hypothetical protein
MNIAALTAHDIGRWVTYHDPPHGTPEIGRLKSWNNETVFVVFKCAGNWDRFQDYTGQGCDPERVTFSDIVSRKT